MKIAVAGTGYVGLSIATLLSQHHEVMAVDIIPEKVELINNKKSPSQDDYIEKYLAEKELNLTAKEFDLLELLMAHPNKVYSRNELLDTIWGSTYPGDARTVDVHVRRLREKIEDNPGEPVYIHTKWGVGYYFKG